MPNKQNSTRKKSRKWNGFKPSDIFNSKPADQEISCVSSRKLDVSFSSDKCESDDYFILINFLLLKKLIAPTICANCFIGNLLIKDNVGSRMGFCHLLEMKCTKCNFSKNFRTSPKSKNSLNTNEFPIDTVKKELSSLESAI